MPHPALNVIAKLIGEAGAWLSAYAFSQVVIKRTGNKVHITKTKEELIEADELQSVPKTTD